MNTMTTEQPYLKHAIPGVLGLEPYSPGMPIDELQRRLGIANAVKLASNENPLGPSPKVKAALAALINDTDVSRYPDGAGFKLKKKIAEFHGIEPERITLGNGSNDIIEFIARVFLGPGRAAMYSAHAFAVYPIVTQAQDAASVIVPALPESHPEMPYGHDLEGFAKLLRDDVTVVFLVNPNNPTGTWMRPDQIEAFLKHVPSHTLVVLDEAYQEYLDPSLRPDSRVWLDRFPNLIVTRTFSKTYGLAGLRAGYSLSHRALADLLNRVRQPFNLNSFALLAAEVALGDQDHVRRAVELNTTESSRLRRELKALSLTVLPSQANFVTVGFGRDSAPVHRALLERGVIVRPMASYQMPQFLRVSVGTEAENSRFLDALKDILK
ncbi:MAG: histidinol-phosphate transaminase [Nevskia sp.]|nr:histidinol-phosphate transaminase [Nevskia sp.]